MLDNCHNERIYRIGIIGTSKAGKSTFITACFDPKFRDSLDEVISENTLGQTKVKVNYRANLEYVYNDAVATIREIHLKPYPEILDVACSEEYTEIQNNQAIQEIKELRKDLSPYIKTLLMDLGVIINEDKLICNEDYKQLNYNKTKLVSNLLTKYKTVKQVFKILNSEESAKVLDSVTIESKASHTLIEMCKKLDISCIEFIDTRGINDTNGEDLLNLEETLEDNNQTNSDQDVNINEKKDLNVITALESKFGLQDADICICMYNEDALTGSPAKILLQLLNKVAARIPVTIVQKSSGLAQWAESNECYLENKDDFIRGNNLKIILKYHFKLINKDLLIKNIDELSYLSSTIQSNFLQVLLPDVKSNTLENESPFKFEMYMNSHRHVLFMILERLKQLINARTNGKDCWNADKSRLVTNIVQEAGKLSHRYKNSRTYRVYPNLQRKGYDSDINDELDDIYNDRAYIQGPRGGVTPFNVYYTIAAVSMTTTEFIEDSIKTLLAPHSLSTYSTDQKNGLYNYLYDCLYNKSDISDIFHQYFHSIYPRSTDRWYIARNVKEHQLLSTENYLMFMLNEFLNMIP